MGRLGRRFLDVGSKFWPPVMVVVAWVVRIYYVLVLVRALWFHAYLHNQSGMLGFSVPPPPRCGSLRPLRPVI